MTEHGTLLVRAFTSRAQVPVVDATVAITQRQADGKHALLAVRTTDESGRTTPIAIATPPREDSLQPQDAPVFTACNLWVEHPQFEMLYVEDVQVFAGVETIQNAALIPLAEHAIPRNESVRVEITPQPL